MKRLWLYLNSSIVKKQIMGFTGLFWCIFLLGHLVGNALMFVGPEAFNTYAYTLTSNKAFFYTAEVLLLFFFLTHMGMAIRLTIENKKARPESYYMKQATGRGSTFASSTMPYTGMIILVFVITHLLHFRFGPVYMITHSGVEMRDVYRVLIEYFSSPAAIAWYIFCIAAVGVHTSHGLWSAFQSIGFSHPRYTPMVNCVSKIYGAVVFLAFSALPIFCYLQGGN